VFETMSFITNFIKGITLLVLNPQFLSDSTDLITHLLKSITPVDYNTLARGIEASNKHSIIIESQSFYSYMEN